MRPPTALPVVANCAACAMLSPSTRFGRSASHSPRFRSTASAARPYGATSGLAMAKRLTPPAFTQAAETLEPFVDRQRRALGREDHQPADGVDHAGIARQARRGQLIRKLLVGRQEHLERRAVLDLPRQGAGRAEHQLHARALGALELLRDLGEREVEIRRRGDRGRPLSRQLRGMPSSSHSAASQREYVD